LPDDGAAELEANAATKPRRASDRARKIVKRLPDKWSGTTEHEYDFPAETTRMRWAAYNRLEAQYDDLENRWALRINDQVRGVPMGNGAGAPRMHSMLHLSLVRHTPIFCRPYTRGADRQPCPIANG
jgi:hypothetical protein